MKALFLDIDGVLNTLDEVFNYGMDFIDPAKVEILKTIIVRTNAQIVLSSTWRLSERNRNLVTKALAEKNLNFIDCTIELPKKLTQWINRAEEIAEWLLRHPQVRRFAILDDNSDAGIGLEKDFFQTDYDVGLTEDTADKIVEHLNFEATCARH